MLVSNRPTLLSFVFFAEGSVSAGMGDPCGANPYQPGTAQHDHWQQGWSSARPAATLAHAPDATA